MGNSSLKKYNINEINEENKNEPRYIIMDKKIYDIKNLIFDHPGGNKCLYNKCSTLEDCKIDFDFHSKLAKTIWNKLLVGILID